MAEIASSTGEIKPVRLADGSQVTLDSASRAHIIFASGERRILLQGRARFDVAHDFARPFIVVAGGEEVVAHGTLFDVAIAGDRVAISLLRGLIEVREASVDSRTGRPSTRRLLTPGWRLVASRKDPLPPRRPVSAAETRWVSGLLSFENTPLVDVIAAANRYSVRQIRLVDDRSKSLRFTGTFQPTKPDDLAAMLAATFRLRLSTNPSGNLLLSSADMPIVVPRK
ncbi:MAG: FecR domain-containing protein [Sphingomonadaceae bacterium]|nr:FecR domain-containing protein [Sphingomonadaceae bacterium]